MIERFGISRKKACTILFCIISLIAIPASLSFGCWSGFKIFGKTLFDFLDFVTSNLMLPLNTLFLCLISGWYLKIRGQNILKNKIAVALFDFGLKFVVPAALIFLVISGLR
jgi:NSS family neurotransmitter:Na+ symporter